MSEIQECEEQLFDLVVVGAGLAALHVVSRLPDKLLQKTVVVDSSGGWLARWSARHERLGSALLRTPVTQHPHASPLPLQAYTEKLERQQELVKVVKGFAPVPPLPLFLDFCRTEVIGVLPPTLRTPRQGTVLRIEAVEGAGVRVHLAGGQVLTARAAIYTPANRCPVVPAWARQLAGPPQPATPPAEPCTPADQAANNSACACVGIEEARQGGSVDGSSWHKRLPAGITTSESVHLQHAQLAGRRVVVVGGGMAAGLLAAGAAERGADVTLVCRRPLKPQPFETDVGWWGAKQLHGYRQIESTALRIQACRRARRQASVHLPVWRRLCQQAAAGRLKVLEGWEVAAAEPGQEEQQKEHQATEQVEATSSPTTSRTWQLALKPYVPAHQQQRPPAGPSLFQQAVAATAAAMGEEAAGGVAGGSTAAQEAAAGQQQAQQAQQATGWEASGHALSTHLVWLACGTAYNAAVDPVLAQLAEQRPNLLTGGYAWLDDEHLCWPGAGVYLAGRGSLLSLGPSAGDLPGMRLAADRIAASLKRLTFADAPVWEGAQQTLLDQLLRSSPAAPAKGEAACGGNPAASEAGQAGVCAQLAAAVATAAVAADDAGGGSGVRLALEEEGLPYEDAPPKPFVAKPDNIIDVSDLSPDLPRRELQQYKMIDDDFELTVVCQLEEAVPLNKVRVLFGERYLEMWAVGEGAAYHLHVPRLYGRLITRKCRAKVNQKARKVLLVLRKDSDAEWRFLKG